MYAHNTSYIIREQIRHLDEIEKYQFWSVKEDKEHSKSWKDQTKEPKAEKPAKVALKIQVGWL